MARSPAMFLPERSGFGLNELLDHMLLAYADWRTVWLWRQPKQTNT